MLCKTLRKSGSHAAQGLPPAASIERAAPYMAYSQISGLHAHSEPNFRKKPASWGGWTNPALQDPYMPYMQQSPVRHVDRGAFFGMWFGMGHFALKNFFGVFAWKFWLRIAFCGVAGWGAALGIWALRMWKNGWQWKNRGAVFGMDA